MRWLGILLLAGCTVEKLDIGAAPVPPWLQDDDGDDYHADEDCDDGDAGIHPGASELCDGRDQDCDLDVDEDAVDAVTRYPDDDGDGAYDRYGSPSCDPPPGATEPGTDGDCDGDADEDPESATTWYADRDSDGYGVDATATRSCLAPALHAGAGGDCDDGDGVPRRRRVVRRGGRGLRRRRGRRRAGRHDLVPGCGRGRLRQPLHRDHRLQLPSGPRAGRRGL